MLQLWQRYAQKNLTLVSHLKPYAEFVPQKRLMLKLFRSEQQSNHAKNVNFILIN